MNPPRTRPAPGPTATAAPSVTPSSAPADGTGPDTGADPGPGPGPLVRLRGVRVRHHAAGTWTGEGTDLELFPGELVLLLGPSGAGKSGLALTVNGLIPHSAPADLDGAVLVRGTDTRTTGTARLCTEVGMVFQDPDAQIVTRTVLDEVCFGPENTLVPAAEVERRALAALRAVGLDSGPAGLRRDPASLSGGERQRLALACALAMRPAVLVLDEPTANLDPLAVRDFYRVLAGLRRNGTTALLIEHQLDDAAPLADRVVVLDHRARVRAQGPPREVFGRHARLLAEVGGWRPAAVEIAERMGPAPGGTTPLTPEELADAVRAGSVPACTAPARTTPAGHPGGAQPPCAAPPLPRPADSPADSPDRPAGSGSAPVAELRSVTVRRQGRTVLDAVSLTVPPGDFLAVAGTNGAGKTTLLRTLAGLTAVSHGEARVEGRPVRTGARGRRAGGRPGAAGRIGYVFQNPEHQFVTGSVRAELAHGPRLLGLGREETGARVDAALDRFGLTRYAERSPFLLSHGEKRRLSVATALITGPRLLLLDEPTFGQDRARTAELLALVDEVRAAGTTVVAVTHDLQLVADHAAHLALLSRGRLTAHAPVRDVLCDDTLLGAAGLRPPPVRRFAARLAAHDPVWARVCRLDDLGSPGEFDGFAGAVTPVGPDEPDDRGGPAGPHGADDRDGRDGPAGGEDRP